MTISGSIKPLKDKAGNYIFPETSSEAVYCSDGTNIEQKLTQNMSSINTDITNLKQKNTEFSSQLEQIEYYNNDFLNFEKKELGIAISLKAINSSEIDNLETYKKQALQAKERLNSCVQLVCFVSVKNLNDNSFVLPDYNNLIRPFLEFCKENNIKINLIKIHLVKVLEGSTNFPNDSNYIKENIKPIGNFESWFVNYKNAILPILELANNYNIDKVVLANENEGVSCDFDFIDYWRNMINEIKPLYPNIKLGYSSMITEHKKIIFRKLNFNLPTLYDYFDFIGINIYPQLSLNRYYNESEPFQNYLKNGNYNCRFIDLIHKCYPSKDIIITETGSFGNIRSLNNPMVDGEQKNSVVQGLFIKTMIELLASRSYIKGFNIWHIREPFNILDTEAEKIVKDFYWRWQK